MGEPVGIGKGQRKYPCAGNPNRPGAVLFECPNEARWVVVAPLLMGDDQGEPSICIVSACDEHLFGVKAWMRDQVVRTVQLLGHEFTEDDEPLVDSVANLGRLEDHFGQMFLAQPGTA